MRSPKVSVITIGLNDPVGVEKTIQSVLAQTYRNIEFIVIDGGSRAETLGVLQSYSQRFTHFVSESDYGIYDAMNKGLVLSSGDWYIMMNAGDIFYSPSIVDDCVQMILKSPVATWAGGGSKVNFDSTFRVFFASRESGVFHHQSLFIKTALHKKYGAYISDNRSNAWDFFFFNLLQNEEFLEINAIVSICDGGGVSSSVKNYLQVSAIAFLFGQKGRTETAFKLLLYPAYRYFRNLFNAIRWVKR